MEKEAQGTWGVSFEIGVPPGPVTHPANDLGVAAALVDVGLVAFMQLSTACALEPIVSQDDEIEKLVETSQTYLGEPIFKIYGRDNPNPRIAHLERQQQALLEYIARQDDHIAQQDARIDRLEGLVEQMSFSTRLVFGSPVASSAEHLVSRAFVGVNAWAQQLRNHWVHQLPVPPIAVGPSAEVSIDLTPVLALYVVEDRARLAARIKARPSIATRLLEAAAAISERFRDGRPSLTVEASGGLIVRIPTKLDADEAGDLYDSVRRDWWRTNVTVEDDMTMALDFI